MSRCPRPAVEAQTERVVYGALQDSLPEIQARSPGRVKLPSFVELAHMTPHGCLSHEHSSHRDRAAHANKTPPASSPYRNRQESYSKAHHGTTRIGRGDHCGARDANEEPP